MAISAKLEGTEEEVEPPFVDAWPVSRAAREWPALVKVPCPFCGAPVGGSCIDETGKGILRNHPARAAALGQLRDRGVLEADRIAREYPQRPPDQPPRRPAAN